MTFRHLDRIARSKRYRTSEVELTCDLGSVKLENGGENNSSLIAVTSASPVSSALDKEYFPYKAIIWFELHEKKTPASTIITDKKTKENSVTNRSLALDSNTKSAIGKMTGSLQLPISLTRTVETEVADSRSLGAPVRIDPRVTTPRASVSFHPVISTKIGK